MLNCKYKEGKAMFLNENSGHAIFLFLLDILLVLWEKIFFGIQIEQKDQYK